jgi:hypothetical protein
MMVPEKDAAMLHILLAGEQSLEYMKSRYILTKNLFLAFRSEQNPQYIFLQSSLQSRRSLPVPSRAVTLRAEAIHTTTRE